MSEQTLPTTARAWHLDSRPEGWPAASNFSLREVDLPAPGPGQLLVANEYLSVDPYMRGRMSDKKSYIEPYEVGAPLDGPAVGRVLVSNAEGFAPGDHVVHVLGWRDHAVLDSATAQKVDPNLAPLTAYIGLERFAKIKEGDVVFVSGAAGAVGSQVGQIAKLKGAGRVIGSAGSDEKVKVLVEEYGYDAAFNYKNGPVAEQLALAAPDGIDVFFDNVGGEHLEAAIGALKLHARIVLSGMVSQYNDEKVVGPRNLWNLSVTRSDILAFMFSEELDLQPDFVREVGGWLAEGKLRYRETVREGLGNTLDAFLAMMRGENVGKMIVKL
ncbi:NADP-dependent oxidoreductase [Streptomyces sp. NPDC006872]|uniref:NADP-dependent oxidoreductase n=1 Tax=Streptomyces sp. NPDC006872 TaxID=3155720 RepID=UPI0033D420F3